VLEPTTPTAAALAASLSGVTLALLGVDYYSLLYANVGALMALHQAEAMGRVRAVIFVVLCTLVGAALGNAALALFGTTNRALLLVGCIIGGFGAQAILTRLLKHTLGRIDNKDEGTKKP
jgi:predicted lysophospholipase L1 biosynthesis ABC-type transport system permease subunit